MSIQPLVYEQVIALAATNVVVTIPILGTKSMDYFSFPINLPLDDSMYILDEDNVKHMDRHWGNGDRGRCYVRICHVVSLHGLHYFALGLAAW